MKRLSLFIFLLCSSTLFAQTSIGVRGGVVLSRFYVNGPLANQEQVALIKDNIGFAAAIPLEFKLTDGLALQPELAFVQHGFKIGDKDLSFDTRINYIELPILSKFQIMDKKIKLDILFGPSVGYAFNGNYKLLGKKIDMDFKEHDELVFADSDLGNIVVNQRGYDYKRFNLSVHAGVAASMPLKTGSLYMDVRYMAGFSDMTTTDIQTINTRALGLSVGYLYPLGKKEAN